MNQGLAPRSEGDDPHAPVFRALDPADHFLWGDFSDPKKKDAGTKGEKTGTLERCHGGAKLFLHFSCSKVITSGCFGRTEEAGTLVISVT
jgi:hypothetical protein